MPNSPKLWQTERATWYARNLAGAMPRRSLRTSAGRVYDVPSRYREVVLTRSKQEPDGSAYQAWTGSAPPAVSGGYVVDTLGANRLWISKFEDDHRKLFAIQNPPGCFEIIVVDGLSTDKTRDVVSAFAQDNPGVQVRVIDNPERDIPRALNLGITAATGELIVRMDAHSIPSPGYVRRCVQLLADEHAALVGMPWKICAGSDSSMARAIALAVAHPFGIGDAKYRLNVPTAVYVDTVPFGAFKKSLWTRLGGFNEKLLTNIHCSRNVE